MSKLKIGDKVKIISEPDSGHNLGDFGEIISVHPNESYEYGVISNAFQGYYNERELELQHNQYISVSERSINSIIKAEQYLVVPGTTMTICALTLENGFVVTGESASVSVEKFDAAIGRKYAREQALNKIWMLEGYLLKQKLYEESK